MSYCFDEAETSSPRGWCGGRPGGLRRRRICRGRVFSRFGFTRAKRTAIAGSLEWVDWLGIHEKTQTTCIVVEEYTKYLDAAVCSLDNVSGMFGRATINRSEAGTASTPAHRGSSRQGLGSRDAVRVRRAHATTASGGFVHRAQGSPSSPPLSLLSSLLRTLTRCRLFLQFSVY